MKHVLTRATSFLTSVANGDAFFEIIRIEGLIRIEFYECNEFV